MHYIPANSLQTRETQRISWLATVYPRLTGHSCRGRVRSAVMWQRHQTAQKLSNMMEGGGVFLSTLQCLTFLHQPIYVMVPQFHNFYLIYDTCFRVPLFSWKVWYNLQFCKIQTNTEGILKVLVFQIAKLAHILQKAQASLLQSEKIKFVPLICKQ